MVLTLEGQLCAPWMTHVRLGILMSGEQRRRLTIIGLGLIGGSLGMALRASAHRHWKITGHDQAHAIEQRALALGAIDRAEPDLAKSVCGSDVVIIATPISAIREVMKGIAQYLPKSCTVTDTASTKRSVVTMAAELLPPEVKFVGGHPLAGKEQQGIDQADGEIFRDKKYVVVASPTTDTEAVSTVESIIREVGAQPLRLQATEHDQYTAAVSHLPLIISTALFTFARFNEAWPHLSDTAASAFRDLTRLASGDPTMSRDICEDNRAEIIRWLDLYLDQLRVYRKQIAEGSDALGNAFTTFQRERNLFLSEKLQASTMGDDSENQEELLNSVANVDKVPMTFQAEYPSADPPKKTEPVSAKQ